MEVKVWMDGYQRVVCGVTEKTTCQDLMVALAQASGMTGRYAMFEKWRATEHCLLPTEYPLLVLRKWGEYSSDVQFILRHSGPTDNRRKVKGRCLEGGPPECSALKKSLTFSGVHRRAHSADHSTKSRVRLEDCARNVWHSVESSEQSSVASQSSASLSPYTSLERQNVCRNGHEFVFDNLHKESLTANDSQQTSSAEKISRFSKEAVTSLQEMQHTVANVVSKQELSRQQPPVPASRQPKLLPPGSGGGVVKSHIPRPNHVGKELLFNLTKKDNISEASHSKSDSFVVSKSPKISSSNTSKSSLSSTATIHSNVQLKQKFDDNHNINDRNLVTDLSSSAKTHILHSPSPRLVTVFNCLQSNGKNMTKEISKDQVHNFEIKKKEETKLQQYKAYGQHYPPIPTKKSPFSKGVKVLPVSQFTKCTDMSTTSFLSHSQSDKINSPKSSDSFDKLELPEISGSESSNEEKQKKEMIQLISTQERELKKCESRLKELNCEISLLESDSEVDEKHLESQLKKIEELEALEKVVENELQELELISWEEKLELERQRGNRLQTEILLLQSSIEKSETEIQASVLRIKGLTSKTEEATKEFDQRMKEKQEKETKEMADLEDNLSHAKMLSQVSERAVRSLEQEIRSADSCLSKRKEELHDLECQLKKLNLELFLSQPPQVVSSRTGRSSLVDRLGLLRPGSSRHLRWSHLNPTPRRLNCGIDEARNHSYGYIV